MRFHSLRRLDHRPSVRFFSTEQQPFVRTRIPHGEWDPQTKTNPLYRPKWKSTTKIISKEDFNNRPKVGFSGEFESLSEAMVTLSWMTQEQCRQVYEEYLEVMVSLKNAHSVTSHEYVIRVLANKFNVTPERIAATIRLQHNEEQYKREGKRQLLTQEADYMDQAIQQEIQNAYKTFRQKVPTDFFIEDPVAVSGIQEPKQYTIIPDEYDVDQLTADADKREREEARLAIDTHVYIEDKDADEVEIPLSKDCKKLLQQKQEMKKEQPAVDEWPAPAGHPKRQRWKYVAQIVNTRQLKKNKYTKTRSYTNNSPADTLVEMDGTLRAGTFQDVSETCWNPTRNVQEFVLGPVKQGWLDKTLRNKNEKWGMAPPAKEAKMAAAKDKADSETKKAVAKDEADSEAKKATAEDEAESSSSSDEGETSSSDEEEAVSEETETEKDTESDPKKKE